MFVSDVFLFICPLVSGRRSLSAAPRRDTGLFSSFKGPSTIAQSGQLRAIEYR
jgi:hypothetical protein